MSGDVQPRKRKDKKRKKDELGVEEPRGTAAALGEGDVFIHTYHDHGTGGHWCAKIIFFSLLAVLVTLIGLIILENRGLTELEANSVESRYSGVLEGWLEDAPEDDHHDEHTLELNHPDDDDEDEHDVDEHDDDVDEHDDDDDDDDEHDDDDDDEHDDEEEHDDEDEDENDYGHGGEEDERNQSDNEDDEDQDVADSTEENDEDEQQEDNHRKNYNYEETDDEENSDEGNDDDELQQVDESDEVNERSQVDGSYEDNDSTENDNNEENDLKDESEEGTYHDEENTDNEDEEDHDEEEQEETEVEIERIETEIDLEPISTELSALPEEDDDDYKGEELSKEVEDQDQEEEDDNVAPEDFDDDYLGDDSDEPPIEHITAPVGKPLVEVEEEDSSEKPPDTLAEEEEYEKQQEEKKREEEMSSHMWLKLSVGGALLVATHVVVRRATAPRDTPAEEERSNREETPVIDRRMTLIPEESVPVPRISTQSYAPPVPKEEIVLRAPILPQKSPPQEEEYEEDEEEKQIEDEEIEMVPSAQDTEDKQLYSEEEIEEEEEEIEVKKVVPKFSALKTEEKALEPEDDPDDVEIIEDEQLEEEVEEEDDEEEEISDVDDVELLSRLEAKYGRLPEPDRPGQKPKDGGNSLEDEWPGEPSDAFWRQELDSAEQDLRRGSWRAAAARAAAGGLRGSARARWLAARAADLAAEARRDNKQLAVAIAAYLDLLKMNEKLSDEKLKQVTERALDRIMFRGTYLSAEPVYRLLIRRFPEEIGYRNNLTIAFLMANRADLAEEILKETLQKWPNDRVALAHYGFVLKTLRNRLEEAVIAFEKALEGDSGPANEPRYYYHLGDALLLLGRRAEAHEVHKRGAKLGHFLSPAQRSLYNVPRLTSRPWWNIDETPYVKLARALEKNWKEILKEGEAAKSLFEKEKEGLKERGDWSQLDLFARGQEIPNRCKKAPVTCAVVRSEPAAVGCRRGQIKFSAMAAGTHVRPHVGPTNCRLRMHLALSNTKNTFIRVDQNVRQWELGKVFMFDDSFEHEVWHNGTGARLVLIVDVWHPELAPRERRALPAI